MTGAIYSGKVRHRRFTPVLHSFSYRMFMVYLDVDEIDNIFPNTRFWNTSGKAIVEFRRADYLFDALIPIGDEIRSIVEKETGLRPAGKIFMLTHLRYFGYIFNPATFYYCLDEDGESVETIITEITNTPWKERHCYVLSSKNRDNNKHKFQLDKVFHVSPFIEMDHRYHWLFTEPGKSLTINMENLKHSTKYFDATLALKRKPLTKSSLRRAIAAYPFMTMKVMGAIYWQALKLKLKGVPYFPHPKYKTE